jgi:hypothetical protein
MTYEAQVDAQEFLISIFVHDTRTHTIYDLQ